MRHNFHPYILRLVCKATVKAGPWDQGRHSIPPTIPPILRRSLSGTIAVSFVQTSQA